MPRTNLRLTAMAKDQKPREPTWQERAAKLTAETSFPDHDGTEARPQVGKRCWLHDTERVLIVYDMRTKTWASEAEKALYLAAGSQAHGAARPARIAMSISMGYEWVTRDLATGRPIRYRIPARSKLKWYSGDKPPKPPAEPKPARVAEAGTGAFAVSVGKRYLARCNACWQRGDYVNAASSHNTLREAEAAAAAHRCKT